VENEKEMEANANMNPIHPRFPEPLKLGPSFSIKTPLLKVQKTISPRAKILGRPALALSEQLSEACRPCRKREDWHVTLGRLAPWSVAEGGNV
jgi:hypothetical protein